MNKEEADKLRDAYYNSKSKYEKKKERRERFSYYLQWANIIVFVVNVVLWCIVLWKRFD